MTTVEERLSLTAAIDVWLAVGINWLKSLLLPLLNRPGMDPDLFRKFLGGVEAVGLDQPNATCN